MIGEQEEINLSIKRFTAILMLSAALMCLAAPVSAYAERSEDGETAVSDSVPAGSDPDEAKAKDTTKAKDVTKNVSVKAKPKCNLNSVLDRNNATRSSLKKDTVLTCTSKKEIGGLYIETEAPAGSITITAGERKIEADEENFLHFYVGGIDAKKFKIKFNKAVTVTNIRFLTKGSLPDWVQFWEPAPQECDLMIMSAHYDDDTLYFGGIAPWALDQGASVVVAFYCDHRQEPYRKHEMLDAVWAYGVRYYPVFGAYADSGLVDYPTAVSQLRKSGITWEKMLERQVEIYRKYKPQIVLTHSVTGEYGHSQHILCEQISTEAAMMAGNENIFPDLTEKYGAHEVSKVYVHNYRGFLGKTVLDLDMPLESFDGRTPYEITVTAFRKHRSQVSGFIGWLTGPGSAAGIGSFSPCEWGLYYSSVGEDVSSDTLFDNIELIRERDNN